MYETDQMPEQVRFLYSTKLVEKKSTPSDVLFLPRLKTIAGYHSQRMKLDVFFTGISAEATHDGRFTDKVSTEEINSRSLQYHFGRMMEKDLLKAIGRIEQRTSTVCYVCGPPTMTDEIVQFLQSQEGMEDTRVLCEKWW